MLFQNEDDIIEFYKARVKYFYSGAVDAVDFNDIKNVVRRSTNQMVAMKTNGQLREMVRANDTLSPEKPMAMFVANHIQVFTFLKKKYL